MSSAIREIVDDQVVWTKGNPKREIEEELCSLEEAYDRIRNSDYFDKILRFSINERIEDESQPKGYRWVTLLDFTKGDRLMTPQATRKWKTLRKLFLDKYGMDHVFGYFPDQYKVDRIHHRLKRGNLLVRLRRLDGLTWKAFDLSGKIVNEKSLLIDRIYPEELK